MILSQKLRILYDALFYFQKKIGNSIKERKNNTP